MNENIDRRVVEMRFDNTDFEKNVESTMSVLDKLKQHLSFNKAGKDFTSSGLPSAIDDVKNRFSALEVIGVTALANITNSAVNLGKRLARSLTIDQVKAGFSEYELKMGSIQTIMASTGEDINTVNKYLNELNTYSDRTIYSFSDMTQNIGKFTNAGVKLDTAVKAIQGISNEAAVSGANAQEASRAMYNFAQALSAGYVKLIDWKSIENANMATVEFKQQLIDSAVAAGTLEKQMDGTYKVLTQGGHGAFKESISATKNFNDSLSAAWMTTDVLTSTLSRYSDETTAIGKKAFAAAQDVKTFSQLMDTIKESIGSGWAQTFEIIFGNLEEAKKLWTAVNNVVSEFVSASSDARNLVLQTWKDLGGREDIAKGIKTAFGSLRDAYMEAFPSATTEQLTKLGEKLKSLTEGFAKGMEVFARLKPQFVDIFTAVSDVVGLAKDAFSGFFRVLSGGEGESIITKLFETFVKFVAFLSRGISALVNFARATGIFKVIYALIKGSYDITAKLVDILSALVTKVSSYAVTIEPILEKTSNAIGSFFDKIDESKIDIIGKAIEGLGKAFSFISESVINFVAGVSQINLSGIAGLLAGGGVFAGALKFSKLLDTIMDKMEEAKKATGIKDAIKGTIDALTDSLTALTGAIKATALKSIATAVLELAIAMKLLASIESDKLKGVLSAITAMFIELGGAIKVMLGITSGGTLKQMFILTRVLSSLSKSLIFMALAAKILSTIDWGGLARGLVGIGVMLLEIGVFMKATSSIEGKAAKSFMGVAISLMLMAKALEMLGKLSWKQIVKGLGAMGGILLEISVFSRTMNSKGMASMGLSMILIASSMIIFGEAMEKIGRMPFKQIEKGLIGIGGSLTAVAIAMRLMPEAGAITSGLGILIVAESLKIMAGAISTMGGMSLKSLAKGLGAMAVALFEIVAAINFANSNLRGAASIFILAEALHVIAGVMTTFGNMNLKQIGKGILAMAGALGVLIAAGFLAGKVALGLLALGGAVALLGAGVLAAGAGIMLMASGLSLLVGTISVGLPIIMTFLTNVIMLIPLFIQQLGYGIIKLFDVLSKGYDSFVKFGVTLLTATMDGIIKTLPKLEELIGVLLETISNVITNDLTMIVDLGITIIFGLLDGITKAIPNLVQKAFEIVITFINSMASAIDRNGDALRSAFVNLIKAILKFLLDSALDFFNMGKTLVGKLKEGVASIKDKVKDAIKDVLDKVKDKIREYYEKFKSAGSYIMEGLKAGIKKIPIIGTVVDIADRMNAAFKNRQKIASPSKVWKQYGIFITQGLANGLTRGRKPVVKALNKIISAFDINGVLVAFTSTSMSSIKGQIDRILENTVNSISWAKNVINQYLGDFTNAQRRSNGTYAASTAVYKGASKAVANFSTKLYKNSQAYQDSAANVQNYNAQIAKEQSNYRTLQAKLKSQEKAYKKAGKKRKKQIKKQIADTKKAMNESLKNIQNLNASLKKELQNIANGPKEAYQAYRENLREIVQGTADILKVGVNDYVSLFERMDEAEEISVNDLLSNMQSQIKGISKWKEDLDKLGKRGIARGLLDKLEAMGPEGAKYIQTFLKMSDEELRKANVMFQAEGELTSDTLIRNMRTQLNAVNNWSENITKIARKGIKYDFLKDLVDAGPDNAEYVQALADMTEAEIAEINALYVKQGNLPSNVADNVLAALSLALDKESRGQLAKSTQTITSAVSQALTFGFGDAATEAGTDVVQALSVGIKAAEPTIKEASKFIGDSALTEFKTFFSTESGNTVAVQMTNGIVSGLTTGQLAVREAARALADAAYTSVTDELEIHSPSKKMEEVGKFSNMGFANGLRKYAHYVESSATEVGGSAYDTIRESLKNIYDNLGSDITNPVITPTLDLSDISRNASKINDMFNDQKIGVKGGANGEFQNGSVINNFTQNNYSPKALPRIDIYRNTKNLMSAAKGPVRTK